MKHLTVEIALAVLVCVYCFNLLSFIKPVVKDIVNCVVIILLIIWALFV